MLTVTPFHDFLVLVHMTLHIQRVEPGSHPLSLIGCMPLIYIKQIPVRSKSVKVILKTFCSKTDVCIIILTLLFMCFRNLKWRVRSFSMSDHSWIFGMEEKGTIASYSFWYILPFSSAEWYNRVNEQIFHPLWTQQNTEYCKCPLERIIIVAIIEHLIHVRMEFTVCLSWNSVMTSATYLGLLSWLVSLVVWSPDI